MNGTWLRITNSDGKLTWLGLLSSVDGHSHIWVYDRTKRVFLNNQSLLVDYRGFSDIQGIRQMNYEVISSLEAKQLAKSVPAISRLAREGFARKGAATLPESEVFEQAEQTLLAVA